ncbi:type 1 glutamine amidotransferase domain-containing protein [Acidisphaera rubrifaciens]|uniref:Peptidase/protease C56/PfpI n=1 Tax=Acidisphaera rubrifaciens HS-AP3 TaxID=1231350 RepID=A0A0D6P8T4_9PROT|nr:type 1 glutamine amidotransferase domain-containing protein [Acidisphaera rubrifaciens]GAN78165.1 peptidase/protease C56/PfpI [Acidisphaera rubrifaciens HS-AP3]
MAESNLNGIKVAILVTDGFEQVEMTEPRKALDHAGAKTSIVSPKQDRVKGWKSTDWGDSFTVDVPLGQARPEHFDALLLPGGVYSPDKLRMNADAVAFVRAFVEHDRPVAAICHGPWTLIETGKMRGRRLASWPSLRTDVRNAGAEWVDQEAVVDGNIVTSRNPDDIPAFNRAMIELFARAGGGTRRAA